MYSSINQLKENLKKKSNSFEEIKEYLIDNGFILQRNSVEGCDMYIKHNTHISIKGNQFYWCKDKNINYNTPWCQYLIYSIEEINMCYWYQNNGTYLKKDTRISDKEMELYYDIRKRLGNG